MCSCRRKTASNSLTSACRAGSTNATTTPVITRLLTYLCYQVGTRRQHQTTEFSRMAVLQLSDLSHYQCPIKVDATLGQFRKYMYRPTATDEKTRKVFCILVVISLVFGIISGKSFKTVAARCRILNLKCTKFDFGWGSVGSLTALPHIP